MIYASGIDSKVISIRLIQEESSIIGSTEGLKQWIYAGSIWGQSHDVKSLCLLNETTLISGGMTTDICIYPLIEGRLMEQFGIQSQIKLRHVPAFEMED